MSVLDKFKPVRDLKRVFHGRLGFFSSMAGAGAGVIPGVGAAEALMHGTAGMVCLLVCSAGGALAAPFAVHTLGTISRKKTCARVSDAWSGVEVIGTPRDIALVANTIVMVQKITRPEADRPQLSTETERRLQLYLEDCAAILSRVELRDETGAPVPRLVIHRWCESNGGRAIEAAVLEKDPDDLAFEAARREMEKFAPVVPAPPVRIHAPPAPERAQLRADTQAALQYLEIKPEINAALAPPQPRARVTEAPEPEAETPASVPSIKMKT